MLKMAHFLFAIFTSRRTISMSSDSKSFYSFGWYTLFYKKHKATPKFISISSVPRVVIAINFKLN